MSQRLHPILTLKRRAWLEKLETDGKATRKGFGRVACDCMRLGWTEWVGDIGSGDFDWFEELTDAGRAVLVEAQT
jgi:hypothetical protein